MAKEKKMPHKNNSNAITITITVIILKLPNSVTPFAVNAMPWNL